MKNKFLNTLIALFLIAAHIQAMNSSEMHKQLTTVITAKLKTNGTSFFEHSSGCRFTKHHKTNNIIITDPDRNIRAIYYSNRDHFFDDKSDRYFFRYYVEANKKFFLTQQIKKGQSDAFFRNPTDLKPKIIFKNRITHQWDQKEITIQDPISSFTELCREYSNR